MTYEREEYMRRQEAEHDMIRMRTPITRRRIQADPFGCPYFGTPKPCPLCTCKRQKDRHVVDSESVARIIERAEIAPIIKQRLIAEIAGLEADPTLARVKAALSRRSVPTIDPYYTAAFNAALDMIGRALFDSDGSGVAGETAQTGSTEGDSAGPQDIAQAQPGEQS